MGPTKHRPPSLATPRRSLLKPGCNRLQTLSRVSLDRSREALFSRIDYVLRLG